MENGILLKNPDKIYYKIGEVSSIVGIPAYVLRFWETEFQQIRPKRTSSGQRLYKKKDIKIILEIKQLLYDQKLTISGAKQYFLSRAKINKNSMSQTLLDEIRSELKFLRDFLD